MILQYAAEGIGRDFELAERPISRQVKIPTEPGCEIVGKSLTRACMSSKEYFLPQISYALNFNVSNAFGQA